MTSDDGGSAGLAGPPRDFAALSMAIAAAGPGLPRRLAQAAGHAMAHPDDVALSTVAQLAAAAGVQPSTLVRLARHFGYSGFTDFQSVFRSRLITRASSYEDRMARLGEAHPATEAAALLDGFLQAARQSLDRLDADLDRRQFESAVKVLAEAGMIYVIARRRAYPLAAALSYGLAKQRIAAVLVDTANGIDPETVGLAGPGDAGLVISFEPYAPETLALARGLAATGAPLVAITDSPMSPLASLARVRIDVAEADFAGFRSLSAGMALAVALPVALAGRRRLRAGGSGRPTAND